MTTIIKSSTINTNNVYLAGYETNEDKIPEGYLSLYTYNAKTNKINKDITVIDTTKYYPIDFDNYLRLFTCKEKNENYFYLLGKDLVKLDSNKKVIWSIPFNTLLDKSATCLSIGEKSFIFAIGRSAYNDNDVLLTRINFGGRVDFTRRISQQFDPICLLSNKEGNRDIFML